MTDRKLLELAAKAYWGNEIDDVCSIRWLEIDQCIGYTHADNQDHNGQDQEFLWNPLTDCGDALRLAVKLNIHLAIECESAGMVGAMWNFDEAGEARNIIEQDAPLGGDDYAATRRAITRAAAEIGKTL